MMASLKGILFIYLVNCKIIIALPREISDIFGTLFIKCPELDLNNFMEESNKLFNKLSINKRDTLFKFSRGNKKGKLQKSESSSTFTFHV